VMSAERLAAEMISFRSECSGSSRGTLLWAISA
jgi:hypothetical protein